MADSRWIVSLVCNGDAQTMMVRATSMSMAIEKAKEASGWEEDQIVVSSVINDGYWIEKIVP
jgi:hypothetical protein